MKDESKTYDFIITRIDDESNTPIGMGYISSYVEYRNSWEIGYVILPQFRNAGYGLDAGKLLVKYGFDYLKAHKILGMCNIENIQSSKIMLNLGMTREAVFRKELNWNDKWTDQCFYLILEDEYKNRI